MTVLDLGHLEMDKVIKILNSGFGARASVINEGQLDFALEKPRMSLRGAELYPELHQKAAVLMETLCKSHTLSDGNKRASIMAAEYLASINGAALAVPLKTARLAVDCAMDAGDEMSEEITAWFKTHIARDELELSVMLEEIVEERDAVASLLGQHRYDEAELLVGGWLAFDSHPESERAWSKLLESWMEREEALRRDSLATESHFFPWFSLGSGLRINDRTTRYPAIREARVVSPVHAGHSLEDLEAADSYVRKSVERLRDPPCGADALLNAGLMLESFELYRPATRVYDRLLREGGDLPHVLSRQLVRLAFSGRYDEAHAVLDRLAARARAPHGD